MTEYVWGLWFQELRKSSDGLVTVYADGELLGTYSTEEGGRQALEEYEAKWLSWGSRLGHELRSHDGKSGGEPFVFRELVRGRARPGRVILQRQTVDGKKYDLGWMGWGRV